jgi:hypothetical protein
MTAQIVQLRDYHLKRLEQKATDVLAEVLPLAEFAKTGQPVVEGADPVSAHNEMILARLRGIPANVGVLGSLQDGCESAQADPWAGCHCPDGVDGLIYESSVGWVFSET